MCMSGAQGGEKGTKRSPATRDTDVCASPCEYWKSNLGPLQEQQVISSAVPSLQLWIDL